MTNFRQWVDISEVTAEQWLNEATTASRYSVDVNFRTDMSEAIEAYAKIALGYVSAALKQNDYHVKHVFDENPLRILVCTRNWDDGEWVGTLLFNPQVEGGSFIIAKGFYNKDRRTASIQSWQKAKGKSPAQVTSEMREVMHELRKKKDRFRPKLKGIPLKRGRKK